MCMQKNKPTLLCHKSALAVSTRLTMADNNYVLKVSGGTPMIEGIAIQT